jgi:hypothetical protein
VKVAVDIAIERGGGRVVAQMTPILLARMQPLALEVFIAVLLALPPQAASSWPAEEGSAELAHSLYPHRTLGVRDVFLAILVAT